MCVCFLFPFILDVRLADVPAGVTQEEDHTGFLIHLPSAVLTSIFLARRIQPFLSLVDREVEFCVLTVLIVFHLIGIFFFFFGEEKSRLLGFELTPRRVRKTVSRLPTEPPGRPAK